MDTKTNDIAGYVSSKLHLINLLNNTNYSKLYDAKISIGPTSLMASIINKLSHKEINYLIDKIEEKI